MRKNITLMALACAFSCAVSAQNVIVNGDFSTPFDLATAPRNFNAATSPVLGVQGGKISITNTDEANPSKNAITIQHKGGSWWGDRLFFRLQNVMEKQEYTVQFDYKNVPADFIKKNQVCVMIIAKDDIYDGETKLGTGYVPLTELVTTTKKIYGTRPYFKPSADWQTFKKDFDFSMICTGGHYSIDPNNKKLRPIEDYVNDVCLLIWTDGQFSMTIDNVAVYPKGGNPSTGIQAEDKAEFNVFVNGKTVFLNNAEGAVEVYNLAGQLLQTVEGDSFAVEEGGVYIVKCGNQTRKIVL